MWSMVPVVVMVGPQVKTLGEGGDAFPSSAHKLPLLLSTLVGSPTVALSR